MFCGRRKKRNTCTGHCYLGINVIIIGCRPTHYYLPCVLKGIPNSRWPDGKYDRLSKRKGKGGNWQSSEKSWRITNGESTMRGTVRNIPYFTLAKRFQPISRCSMLDARWTLQKCDDDGKVFIPHLNIPLVHIFLSFSSGSQRVQTDSRCSQWDDLSFLLSCLVATWYIKWQQQTRIEESKNRLPRKRGHERVHEMVHKRVHKRRVKGYNIIVMDAFPFFHPSFPLHCRTAPSSMRDRTSNYLTFFLFFFYFLR